jgi:Protein of unknown function (DUF3489)
MGSSSSILALFVSPESGFGLCPVRTPDCPVPITEATMPKTKTPVTTKKARIARAKPAAKSAASVQHLTSKSDQILTLLRRKQGASLEEMQTVSGWQPHSVRGYMSGTVKKRMGLHLTSSKSKDGVRHYAIAPA